MLTTIIHILVKVVVVVVVVVVVLLTQMPWLTHELYNTWKFTKRSQ